MENKDVMKESLESKEIEGRPEESNERAKAFENSLVKLSKRFFLIIVGSGLFTNALYLYGLSYYQGNITGMGFQYEFFAINWNDALFWAYLGSREIGSSTLGFWSSINQTGLLIFVVSMYSIIRLWIAISAIENSKEDVENRRKKAGMKLEKAKVFFKKYLPSKMLTALKPIRWFLVTEDAVWAFLASYFSLIILFFIPLFLIIWIYFPMIGIAHGESVGEARIEKYSENLCGDAEDYWNQCIRLSGAHVKGGDAKQEVFGNLVAKRGTLLGLLTENGPVTITMPKDYYYLTPKNEKYEPKKAEEVGGEKKSKESQSVKEE